MGKVKQNLWLPRVEERFHELEQEGYDPSDAYERAVAEVSGNPPEARG